MNRTFLALAISGLFSYGTLGLAAVPSQGPASLHHPAECPVGIEGHYNAFDGDHNPIQIIVERNEDGNLTLGYYGLDGRGPSPDVINGLINVETDVDGTLLARNRMYCQKSVIYEINDQISPPERSFYTWSVLPNGSLRLADTKTGKVYSTYSRRP